LLREGYHRTGVRGLTGAATLMRAVDLALTIASAVAAGIVVAAIALMARGSGVALARVALPVGIALLALQTALGEWSLAAFGLLAALIASAAMLAVRGGSRDHAPTWIALGVFAIAGLVGGYGVLAHGLCAAGDAYGCGGTAPDLLALAGSAIALAAYAYLGWQALRP
jgi:hypothetical protein